MLNNETLELMSRPRCSEGDNNFRVFPKWDKRHLTWYFLQTNEEYRKLSKEAFK